MPNLLASYETTFWNVVLGFLLLMIVATVLDRLLRREPVFQRGLLTESSNKVLYSVLPYLAVAYLLFEHINRPWSEVWPYLLSSWLPHLALFTAAMWIVDSVIVLGETTLRKGGISAAMGSFWRRCSSASPDEIWSQSGEIIKFLANDLQVDSLPPDLRQKVIEYKTMCELLTVPLDVVEFLARTPRNRAKLPQAQHQWLAQFAQLSEFDRGKALLEAKCYCPRSTDTLFTD